MKKSGYMGATLLLLAIGLATGNCTKKKADAEVTQPTGEVAITFKNTVNGSPMVTNGPLYTNPFGENYTITKFKYYISNIQLSNGSTTVAEKESYHLIDQAGAAVPPAFSFAAVTSTFNTISFTLGVDSLRNVSGAQTGALDPLNDMFWTWNSGYIMAKLEGNSPSSNQPNNKIEYHIGGFKGSSNVLKRITLTLPAGKELLVRASKKSEVTIEADVNKWWQTPNDIRIVTLPVCTTPGTQALQIADNYAKMFTLVNVINN